MTGTIDPYEVALAIVRPMDALAIPCTVGGSIASAFAGEPRSTVDIDIVAAIEERHAEALVWTLSPAFYFDEEALRRAVRTRTSVNAIHQSTLLKVDLLVAGGTPLDA